MVADGSVCGVDTERFRPDPEARVRTRRRLRIPEEAFVFLFLGRLYREKGVYELAEAFESLRASHPEAHLLLVGPDEEGVVAALGRIPGVTTEGFTDAPEEVLAAADVLCLPSHREGFGLVIIEAAACGVPAIGSDIYGISDAIVDGETGILHRVGSVADLRHAMSRLIEDRDLARRMGRRRWNGPGRSSRVSV